MYPISGILKYGDSDSSILLQCPLTSASSITDVGGVLVDGTDETFDSVLGMLPGAGGGANWLDLTGNSLLETSGQISIEVQNPWVGYPDAASYSDGYNATHDEYLIQVKPTVGTQGRLYKPASSDKLIAQVHTGDTFINRQVSANDKSDFATITWSWDYGEQNVYIDGVLLAEFRARTEHQSSQFQNIVVGNSLISPTQVVTHYVRNLIVSTQPVRRLAVSPILIKVAVFGDSFATVRPPYPYNSSWVTPDWDCDPCYKFDGYLRSHGIAVGEYDVQASNGGTITDRSVPEVGLENSGGRAAMLANNPTLVVMQAGINDLNLDVWDIDEFETDLKDHVTTILGVAKKLVLLNTISNYGDTSKATVTAKARWEAQNEVVATIPAWWDAANPSDTGRVIFYDVATEMGGWVLNDNYSLGQITGAMDDVHLSPIGSAVMGRAWAKGVLKGLG